jgi:hypothetical protein
MNLRRQPLVPDTPTPSGEAEAKTDKRFLVLFFKKERLSATWPCLAFSWSAYLGSYQKEDLSPFAKPAEPRSRRRR